MPGWWSQRGKVRASAEGRGAALFIDADGRRWCCAITGAAAGSHVCRSIATCGRERSATRSFVEWHLLYVMRRAACRCRCRSRPATAASAATATRRPADRADPERQLAGGALAAAPLPLIGWIAIGRCLRRFHDDGVCHADLNAHNVLLDDAQEVWLVDFDRGRLRRPGLWCDSNLVRLRRSIEKITDALPAERFSEADWASLLSGYFSAAPTLVARRSSAHVRRLYTLLLYLALPLASLIVLVRGLREREYWRGWRERFGFGPQRAGGGIWVHAVSVGEVQAAALLIEALRQRAPRLEITLTCATPTGRARARALLPGVEVRYAPYDLPGSVRRYLARAAAAIADRDRDRAVAEPAASGSSARACRR